MKVFLVWNKEVGEGVVFADRNDANFAARPRPAPSGTPALADEWRKIHGESGEQYEVQEIEI